MIEQYFTATAVAGTPEVPTSPTRPVTPATPTPLPNPDAKAMIQWQELQLPPDFVSLDPASVGVGEGDVAYQKQLSSGSVITYLIEASFAFSPGWPEAFFGYTYLLPTSGDQQSFDVDLLSLQEELRTLLITDADAHNVSQGAALPGASKIGDQSRGVAFTYSKAGTTYRMSLVRFRVGDIGATVILRLEETDAIPLSIADLARVYARSILYPQPTCRLVSINPIQYEIWPAFKLRAEGFYPGEGRLISLTGEMTIGGEAQTATTALMGMEGQSANTEGQIEEMVSFGKVDGANVIPPAAVEITIRGTHSGCELSKIVAWEHNLPSPTPSHSLTPSQTATATPTNSPTKTATSTRTPTPSKTATKTKTSTPRPTRTRRPTSTPTTTLQPTPTKIVDLLPSDACLAAETLIYMEDFQDGHAEDWPAIENGGMAWEIVPDPLTAGNLALLGVTGEESSGELAGYSFDQAVFRVKFMPMGDPIHSYMWLGNYGGYEVEGTTIDFSGYNLWIHPPNIRLFRSQPPLSNTNLRDIPQTMANEEWHLLEMATYQGRLEIWIDGELFLSFDDPDPLPDGFIAIGAGYIEQLDPDAMIYFDDIAVCGLSKPFVPMGSPAP